ncbi:MAG: hypothetical protein EB127_11055 [Alphaproteobacteria bacterium]|nr:hypothetical protein [Alphaproteobacteria bacterium]
MTSIGSFYAQRDNRFIEVPLTGYVTNNGSLDNGNNNPAVASLNVQTSKLFFVDTRNLVIRGSSGPYYPVWYLVGIVFSTTRPPKFYPGFEINIVLNVKDTNGPPPYPLIIRIQKNPAVPLDYADEETYIELDNIDYANSTDTNTVYTYGHRTITLLSTGVDWVMKSSYLNNGPSSIFM